MSEQLIQCIDYSALFYGAGGPPAAAAPNGTPFCKRDTSASGSPSILGVDDGGWKLLMDSTSEAQIIGFDCNDILPFNIDKLASVEWEAKLAGTPGANVNMVMGMAGAYNATMDSVAQNAWFKLTPSSATVYCESDDGTNDNDDKSTGLTLSTSWRRFKIDFGTGVYTRSAPSASLGGKANVLFYMGDANGHLTRVATSTQFDMSNYSGGLQPYFQVQKASGTVTDSLFVRGLKLFVREL